MWWFYFMYFCFSSNELTTEYEALVSGLQPHNSYAVRIQAINQIEQSEYTEPVIVKTQEEGMHNITFH